MKIKINVPAALNPLSLQSPMFSGSALKASAQVASLVRTVSMLASRPDLVVNSSHVLTSYLAMRNRTRLLGGRHRELPSCTDARPGSDGGFPVHVAAAMAQLLE